MNSKWIALEQSQGGPEGCEVGHPCYGVPSAKAPSASSSASAGSVSAKGCQRISPCWPDSHQMELNGYKTCSKQSLQLGRHTLLPLGRDLQNQQERRKYQGKLRTEPDCHSVVRGSRKPAHKDRSLYFCNRDISKTSNSERGNWIFVAQLPERSMES